MPFEIAEQEATRLLWEHYGLRSRAMTRFQSELGTVYRVETDDEPLSFKAMGAAEHRLEVVLWHAALMERTSAAGLPVAQLVPPLVGGSEIATVSSTSGEAYLHVTSWLAGTPLIEHRRSAEILRTVGRAAARVSTVFAASPKAPRDITHPWRLELTGETLRSCMPYLTGADERRAADRALALFTEVVEPALPALPRSVVHHDLHDSNLLFSASPDKSARLTGILDFGDAVYGVRVAELAVAAGYASRGTADPAASFAAVVKGWLEIAGLSPQEASTVLPAAIGRLAVNIALWRFKNGERTDGYAQMRSSSSLHALTELCAAYRDGLGEQIQDWAARQLPAPSRTPFTASERTYQ